MLEQAIDTILARTDLLPSVAIVLGSGLGGLANRIDATCVIPYDEIPGWSKSSAAGHRGELILGSLESTPVVAMVGRLHRYEGWTHQEVVFPIHVMAALGATKLIVSNASGGVNPQLKVGEIVVIRDHINLIPGCFPSQNARREGAPSGGWLQRRGEVYDWAMSQIAMRTGIEHGFAVREGTYLATLGPTYETRSEYRMMRRIGADVAGMSTVPEVLAALDEKMRVLGISMVSNVANPDVATSTDHSDVLEAGRTAETKMESIVRAVIRDQG